jgi:flagellar biosynthesis/type III secretory pathway M-ring protein FliF/YscJ
VEFDNSAATKEDKDMRAMASKAMYLSVGKTVGAVLLLFAFLFFLKTMLGQVKISVSEPVRVQEVPFNHMAAAYDMAGAGQESAPPPNISQAQPEEVAQVLRKWMSEN